MNTDPYELVVTVNLPISTTADTRMHLVARRDGSDAQVVLEKGTRADAETALVRVHSACLTGDIFGSMRCDCGPQLQFALEQICASPWGMLVYACEHEGRGIGLAEKLRAYVLQEAGRSTFEANVELGHPEDARDYSGAGAALRLLGATSVNLISSNPAKSQALEDAGVSVRSIQRLDLPAGPVNERYLTDKRARFDAERLLLSSLTSGADPLSATRS